jgi:cytochrome c5
MIRAVSAIFVGIVLLACTLAAFARPQKPAPAPAKQNATADPGEQAFRQNCGRCHNPPESLSPREVKAVVRQMRVRAMLTQKDAELILKYLAP